MSFISKVQASYVIAADAGWKEGLATLLLADSVASVVDGSEDFEKEFEEYADLLDSFRNEIIRSQTDIVENVKGVADKYKLDLKRYLDIALIDKISAAVKKDLGVTLEEIEDEDETWASHTVLEALGHGVSPFDDDGFAEWLADRGSDKKEWNHQYFEGPYSEAMDFVEDALSKKRADIIAEEN